MRFLMWFLGIAFLTDAIARSHASHSSLVYFFWFCMAVWNIGAFVQFCMWAWKSAAQSRATQILKAKREGAIDKEA